MFVNVIVSTIIILSGCRNNPAIDLSHDFTVKELEYFAEIAFGTEFGYVSKNPRLLYWRSDVKVQLNGKYTIDDSIEILKVIEELNKLIDPIELKLVRRRGNLNVHFDCQASFQSFPHYVSGNAGFFSVERYAFFPKAYALIDINKKEVVRKHLIREEITQILGLRKDSWLYPESIFYQGWSETTEYAEIDRQLIRLLYNCNLPYGMKKSEFVQIINNLKNQ